MEKKTRKEMYDESLFDLRTHINGETAIRPYYYFRNGTLHVRYAVDRCMKLTPSESNNLKAEMTLNPSDKQGVLEKAWKFYSDMVGKEVIFDGIAELEKQIMEYRKNGKQS